MKLYYSPTSPFVRKVNVFAIESALDDQIEWVKTNPWQVEDVLTSVNPLSQVPTLITDDGKVLFDSRVICEYLDSLRTSSKLIPEQEDLRWPALRLQALADGILESGISRFLERKREADKRSTDWDELQKNSIERALNLLESDCADWSSGTGLNIGLISAACALGWLDFRFADEAWREARPQLTKWFEGVSQRDSMRNTMPKEALV